jgi:hypothetical protein
VGGVHDLKRKKMTNFQDTTTNCIIPLWRQRCLKSAQIRYFCRDLTNQAKVAEIVTELLLGRTLIQTTEIDIAACAALADG